MITQTSLNINDPNLFLNVSAIGNFNDKTSDTSGYGELSAVEQNQTYFAYFDGAGRQDPELPKQTTFFIKYLIDVEGNVTKPQPNTPSIVNLIDNFETGKPVIITTRTPSIPLKPLLGEKIVTHVGELSTLLITNTGSGKNDYQQSISFIDSLGATSTDIASNYNGSFRWYGLSTVFNNISIVGAATIPNRTAILNTDKISINSLYTLSNLSGRWSNRGSTLNPAGSVATWIASGTPGTQYYRFDKNTTEGLSRVKFSLQTIMRVLDVAITDNSPSGYNLDYNDEGVNGVTDITVTFTIDKLNNAGVFIQNIGSYSTTINNISENPVYFETGYFNFNAGERVAAYVQSSQYSRSPLENGERIKAASFTSQCILTAINENQNIGTVINGVNGATFPYFEIGEYPDQNGDISAPSLTTSVLTASVGMNTMYRPGLIQSASTSMQNYFYMKPWQEWYQLIPGDKIIFENDKNNVHTITEILQNVLDSNGSSSFGLKVVPGIPTGSIINNFCVYRILDNGAQIMIDQEKPPGTASEIFKGFIKPKYISQELENKFIDIVNKLEADGLLT